MKRITNALLTIVLTACSLHADNTFASLKKQSRPTYEQLKKENLKLKEQLEMTQFQQSTNNQTISYLMSSIQSLAQAVTPPTSTFTTIAGETILLPALRSTGGVEQMPTTITGYTFTSKAPTGTRLQLVCSIATNPNGIGGASLNYYTLTIPTDYTGTLSIGYQYAQQSSPSKTVYTIHVIKGNS